MDPAVRRLALTVIVGALAVVFDTTIVSVALNDLARGLHASLATIQWVSTAYLLALFATIPIAGWAQSRLGGKRLWIAALSTFLLGSVLCALAWNAGSLIAFRVVQGVGGGIMMPLVVTLVMQAAKGRNPGRVMAAVTLPTALGPILGPVLGGVILELADWRRLFVVNIPFCLVGILLARRNLPDDRPAPDSPHPRLDVTGLLLLSPGVVAVIYGLSRVEGGTGFADAEVLVPLLGGIGLLGAFTVRSLTRKAGKGALVNLRLFRHRALASSATLGFLAGITLYGAMFLLPLYLQQVRGEDALGAGLLLIPQGVGLLLARTVAGTYTDRLGPRPVALVGFAVVAAATVPFALVTAGTSTYLLMAALFVRGFGMGTATIPLTGAAYAGLAHHEIPDASIITRVAQQVGGSVGIAVLAVVVQHTAAGAHTPTAPTALADGFGEAFWWSVAVTAVAVPLCLLLPGRPKPQAAAAPAADEAGAVVLDRSAR
ncbi:MDR family MFS transporter [Streptomyces sp. SID3212]|uniref:MDR family MFS transporter n=1 Tax=Streptomyces sp. SID3212 TaxID=2690259 RepID=UPI001370D392|nr:MDR family MFS transporter [Streptomyces sp. SID3212]MYV57136.1 DHA2 family efflux MFS transporter permease subunit [Streptomyces sp. SID3212]